MHRTDSAAEKAFVLFLGALAVWAFFRFLWQPLLPFLTAWAAACLLEPLLRRLTEKTRLPRRVLALTLLLLLTGVLCFVLGFLADTAADELRSLAGDLPGQLEALLDRVKEKLSSLGFSGTDRFRSATEAIVNGVLSSVSTAIPGAVSALFTGLPDLMLFTVVFFVSCFYFCVDLPRLHAGIGSLLPETWGNSLRRIRHNAGKTVLRCLRAYLILMLLTFAELYAGFLLLRVGYPMTAAFLTALVDLLPILGVGTVLVPWALYCLLTGDAFTGIGLLILFAAVTLVRRVTEPKLLGQGLGLHPLVTLIPIYAGYRLLGVAGMLLLPAAVITAADLMRERAGEQNEKKGMPR